MKRFHLGHHPGKGEHMEIRNLDTVQAEVLKTEPAETRTVQPLPGVTTRMESEDRSTLSGTHGAELQHEQVEQIARTLEQFTASLGKELSFHVHEESNRIQVDVIDPRDKRVIRKIPPDEILELAASIEKTVGLFLNRIL
jgi:uncharacterized FlaG/YvyC family protein